MVEVSVCNELKGCSLGLDNSLCRQRFCDNRVFINTVACAEKYER